MAEDLAEKAEEFKNEVAEQEKEIATIKARLKALGPASENEAKNSLTLELVKTEGLPEAADLKIKVQLSSPIEEAVLTKENTTITFQAVEVGQAMVSMLASDADIPLGSSGEPLDLASLFKFDAMQPSPEYSVQQEIAFAGAAAAATTTEETVFHANIKLTFVPSSSDQREELFEMLNKATSRKALAVEKLRQTALAASRRQQQQKASPAEQAVKAGFLNKSASQKEKTGLSALVEKYFGPRSFVRMALPVAKNYVIFFAAVVIFHYKGDALALPPPV